jgi:aquaporin Z
MGTAAAFAAEFFMASLLMAVVLITSNQPRLEAYTTYSMGVLIAFYILLFAPVSGFSINPARTVGSAVFAHIWTALWVYFTAPVTGMFFSAEVYVRLAGTTQMHPVTPGLSSRKVYFSHRHVTSRLLDES